MYFATNLSALKALIFYPSHANCAASAISRTSGREVAAATSQRHAELSSAINHGKLPLHE
ncbi:hypothetical protein FA041_27320 [Escherichia coli]|nr:hypothetical protein [Escherichia coli]